MTHALWTPLRRELAHFRADGLRLRVWWRDDDAIQPTRQLDRLSRLSEQLAIPVHLAIIPAHARPELEPVLTNGRFRGVVHGWAHANHAPPDQKSSEFGGSRRGAAAEAAEGLVRLRSLFGPAIHAMFVPPWNRIDDTLLPGLSDAGYGFLSVFGPRVAAEPAPGLRMVNTHVDPVDWRGTRGLADPQTSLDRLAILLRSRRRGDADLREPLGLLTHHLMMDDPTWDFCHGLLSELREGPLDLFDIAVTKDFP